MVKLLFETWFLKALVVVNFIGTLWGIWWYHLQLAVTPITWWIIVPDSPFSSGLFTLSLILYLKGIRAKWFHLLACFLSIKYGIWAVAVISDYWLQGGNITLMETMLMLSHLGMAVEGMLYLPLVWPEKYTWLPFVFFTWINDGADYIFSKHPTFFYDGQEPFGMLVAIALSFVLSAAALVVSKLGIEIQKKQKLERI